MGVREAIRKRVLPTPEELQAQRERRMQKRADAIEQMKKHRKVVEAEARQLQVGRREKERIHKAKTIIKGPQRMHVPQKSFFGFEDPFASRPTSQPEPQPRRYPTRRPQQKYAIIEGQAVPIRQQPRKRQQKKKKKRQQPDFFGPFPF